MTDTTTAEAPKEKKDVVPSEFRERYKATGGTCGDFIGTELQRVAKDGPVSLVSVMKENDIPTDQWSHLNIGMQRMNLANVLRGRFLNGQTVRILGKEYDLGLMQSEYDGEIEDSDLSISKFARWANLNDQPRIVAALRKTLFPGEAKPTKEEREAARAAAKAAKEAEKAAKKESAEKTKAEKAAQREAEKAAKAAAAEKAKAEKAAQREAEKAAKAAKAAKAE